MAQLDRALGKLKEAAGSLTGDNGLKASGKVDQAAGYAKPRSAGIHLPPLESRLRPVESRGWQS